MRAAFGETGYLAREAVLGPGELDQRGVDPGRGLEQHRGAFIAGQGGDALGHSLLVTHGDPMEWADGSDPIRLLEPVNIYTRVSMRCSPTSGCSGPYAELVTPSPRSRRK
jgi:hypothetical protein